MFQCNTRLHPILPLVLVVIASAWLGTPAFAIQEDVGTKTETASGTHEINYRVVTDRELDATRGGFLLPNGLMVNFSIEKRIYHNGVETFASFFEAPQNLSLLQSSGLLNSGLDNPSLNTLIQNDLDNQILNTINTINIELSNLREINRAATQSNVFRTLIQPGLK